MGLKISFKSDSYALGNANKRGKAGEINQGLCCGRLIVSRKKIKEKKVIFKAKMNNIVSRNWHIYSLFLSLPLFFRCC